MLDTHSRMATWYRDTSYPKTLQRMQTHTFVYERIKRMFDIVLSALLLILLSPLLLVLALAIKLDSPGPVLFVQRRTGRYGRPFNFFKFRSMSYSPQHVEVHRAYVRQYANGADGAETANGVHKPLNNGLVITRVGKVLRQTSLDELPQLWNILRGDMSFVGPRAWADYELESYKDWHYRRLEVLPGLTGLAQINGRSALAFDQIIRLDIDYIDQRSLWLDAKILLKTVPVVLSGNNTG
ncbi:MAG TPA: sugar transferase [Anaerolineae bacterium]|nr:sugar transferase [Anaerolineae bacterium]HNU03769.1 sugar transferase [Anaerolineae bacterium]